MRGKGEQNIFIGCMGCISKINPLHGREEDFRIPGALTFPAKIFLAPRLYDNQIQSPITTRVEALRVGATLGALRLGEIAQSKTTPLYATNPLGRNGTDKVLGGGRFVPK